MQRTCKQTIEVPVRTKMNVFVWILRSLLEPAIWRVLQWIWTFDNIPMNAANLPLHFYSYSSTTLLLWIYEHMPHALILSILSVGCLTILGLILIFSCCSCRVSWWILSVIVRVLVVRVVKAISYLLVVFVKVIFRIVCIGFTQGRKFVQCILSSRSRQQHGGAIQGSAVMQAIGDEPAVTQPTRTETPLSAAAFRPRRRRTRSTRLPPE